MVAERKPKKQAKRLIECPRCNLMTWTDADTGRCRKCSNTHHAPGLDMSRSQADRAITVSLALLCQAYKSDADMTAQIKAHDALLARVVRQFPDMLVRAITLDRFGQFVAWGR